MSAASYDSYLDQVEEEHRQAALAHEIIDTAVARLLDECPLTYAWGDGAGGSWKARFCEGLPRRPEPIPRSPKRHPLSARRSLEIFSRDGYRCQSCDSRENLTVDHRRPVSRGGSDDAENLWTLCAPCNSSKGTRTVEEWLA